jgi:hypothetical protein
MSKEKKRNSVRKVGLLLVLILCFSKPAISQNPFEPYFGLGLSVGVSNYTGDLSNNFSYKFSKYGVGGYLSLVFSKHFRTRLTVYNGEIAATDLNSSIVANRNRNLAFRSQITEVGAQVVYNILGKRAGFLAHADYTPYVFLGIAVFHFNPQDSLNGIWYDLLPLGTEGQQMHNPNLPPPYALTQICIPFGFGFDYKLLDNLDIGIELGFRKTFTDYLDDVSGGYPDETLLRENEGNLAADLSNRTLNHNVKTGGTRGDPTANDSYFYTNLHITYYFYWAMFGGRFVGSKHSGDCWAFPESK